MFWLRRLDQQCHGLRDVSGIDPVPDSRARQDRLVSCLHRRQNLRLRARRVAHVVAALPGAENGAQAYADDFLLPETSQPRSNLFGCEFGDGVERGRVAGRLFVEQRVPECARAIGGRGRQIDDAFDAALLCRHQDRRLRQQIDLQNGLGIAGLALRPGSDRGPQDDGVIPGRDRGLHRLAIPDIALDSRQPIAIARKILPHTRRQARAVEQCHGMTARQQRCRDIEPDETGAAEDENLHRSIQNHRDGRITAGSRQNSARGPCPASAARSASPPRRRCAAGSGPCRPRPNACRPPR